MKTSLGQYELPALSALDDLRAESDDSKFHGVALIYPIVKQLMFAVLTSEDLNQKYAKASGDDRHWQTDIRTCLARLEKDGSCESAGRRRGWRITGRGRDSLYQRRQYFLRRHVTRGLDILAAAASDRLTNAPAPASEPWTVEAIIRECKWHVFLSEFRCRDWWAQWQQGAIEHRAFRDAGLVLGICPDNPNEVVEALVIRKDRMNN